MEEDEENRSLETLAIHSGREIDEETKAVVPPIHLSTTFEREKDGSYPKGYIYVRNSNPNRDSLEECLSNIEGGKEAAAFSSGTAAAMAVFQSLEEGSHIIAPDDVYHGTSHQLDEMLKGIDVTYVDMTAVDNVKEAVKPETSLFWIETPSNPLLKITDIEKVSEIARGSRALSVVDNTWSTGVCQRPLDHGADLVVDSTTKYYNGHSDTMGGAVVTKSEDGLWEKIKEQQIHAGGTLAPFDCWLTLRGIRTLPLRMKKHSENAMKIAEFLSEHPDVKEVYYPGLESHPGHEIAEKQMELYSGMLSFRVKGGKDKAFDVAGKVDLFTRATSLGAVESYIEHRASIEGEGSTTPDDLLRLSVGLENCDELIEDLKQAIEDK